jgi:hypothetical protein
MQIYLQWFQRVLQRNPSGRARSTSQKPDSPSPVQVVTMSAVIQRHRSPLICYTADEGTARQRSGGAKNWEEEDKSAVIRVCPPSKGRLPSIEGSPQPPWFDLLYSRNRPSNISTCNRLKISHVTCVLITLGWHDSLSVVFDSQINKRQKLNCCLEHVATRSCIVASHKSHDK